MYNKFLLKHYSRCNVALDHFTVIIVILTPDACLGTERMEYEEGEVAEAEVDAETGRVAAETTRRAGAGGGASSMGRVRGG